MKLSESEKNRLKTNYGLWAIVSGASSGIGKELALRLAEAGIHLVINARSSEVLQEMASSIQSTYPVQVKAVAADISSSDGISQVIDAANGLDVGVLVASAGYGTSGLFLETSLHAEINMLEVNCRALLALAHHYSQQFARKRRGGIILMSSMVAFQGVPYAANYAATKAYVQSLAEALQVELKPWGVDVLAAAPGPVTSGFGQRANMKMNMSLSPEDVGVPILKALGRQTTVFPGILTKVLVYSLRTVPRWCKVKIMSLVMGGMTAHQRR
ncbi:MAG: SDR family NAD(P)-dependent oxidoreductase [Cytophagales bacterium]|nr:SDR family NAD(P)-dependent oxidoreductase [Cytophagales bacterium]